MIKAKKNRLFQLIFGFYLKKLLRKHFFKIRLLGKENFNFADKSIPSIIFANHSNWWDGFIAFYLARNILNIDSFLMMDLQQMRKYSFFKWLGAFSVDKNSLKSAMESIEYSVQLLKNSDRVLWIYPQGTLLNNNIRPIIFQSGMIKIAEMLGSVNLIPMAMSYEYNGEQRPEIFLTIGKPELYSDKNSGTELLEQKLTEILNRQSAAITENNLGGFKTIFYGKDSRNKTVDKIYRENL